MGVLAHGSAHARPSAQPPINVSGNFLPPVSAEWPSNISPIPSKVESKVLESHFGIYLKLPHFPVKTGLIRTVTKVCFLMESEYFCYFGAHTKFQNPMICPSELDLKFVPFLAKIGLISGGRGVPESFLLHWNSNNFVT